MVACQVLGVKEGNVLGVPGGRARGGDRRTSERHRARRHFLALVALTRGPAARARDRLRRQVLEDLGWRIHRVWSTDWYHAPDAELQRMLQAVEDAEHEPASAPPEPHDAAEEAYDVDRRLRPARARAAAAGVVEYTVYAAKRREQSAAFYDSPRAVGSDVAACVKVEGPIHEDELIRRVSGLWGIARVGARVRDLARAAVASCLQGGKIARRGAFLWLAGFDVAPVRRRGEGTPRDPKLICPEELGRAAVLTLRAQYGMSPEDLFCEWAGQQMLEHLASLANCAILASEAESCTWKEGVGKVCELVKETYAPSDEETPAEEDAAAWRPHQHTTHSAGPGAPLRGPSGWTLSRVKCLHRRARRAEGAEAWEVVPPDPILPR
jgi:hypothetical protein